MPEFCSQGANIIPLRDTPKFHTKSSGVTVAFALGSAGTLRRTACAVISFGLARFGNRSIKWFGVPLGAMGNLVFVPSSLTDWYPDQSLPEPRIMAGSAFYRGTGTGVGPRL